MRCIIPGEDPKTNGDYAEAFVTGMQGDQSSGYLKVSACLKHYAVYSQETSRQSFPAMVTEQDMEDTYLPAFQVGTGRTCTAVYLPRAYTTDLTTECALCRLVSSAATPPA